MVTEGKLDGNQDGKRGSCVFSPYETITLNMCLSPLFS